MTTRDFCVTEQMQKQTQPWILEPPGAQGRGTGRGGGGRGDRGARVAWYTVDHCQPALVLVLVLAVLSLVVVLLSFLSVVVAVAGPIRGRR